MTHPQSLLGKIINYRLDPGGGTVAAVLHGEPDDGVVVGPVTSSSATVYGEIGQPAATGVMASIFSMANSLRSAVSGSAAAAADPAATPSIVGFPRSGMSTSVWGFDFLKYVPGRVTSALLTRGVMTGPMSGCYLFTFSVGGVDMMAHVGTADDPGSAESAAAKNAWRRFVARGVASGIMGAAPDESFSSGEIADAMLGELGRVREPPIVGYFYRGEAFAMILTPVPKAMAEGWTVPLMKVSAIKKMTLQPWSVVANLKAWRT